MDVIGWPGLWWSVLQAIGQHGLGHAGVGRIGLRRLLPPEERQTHVFEFMIDDLARANLAARMEAYAKAIGCRVLLPNEARAMENRAPLPGGDEFPPVAGAAPALPAPDATTGDEA